MPFKSQAQKRFLYAKHPEIAKKWSNEFPGQTGLPEHATKKKADVPQIVRSAKARIQKYKQIFSKKK